ncbi:MAG: hypothetical protein HY537_11560 [Deltaproteobacteria bacterium]|nr:hypothetical protein [Deltaproteobacteria bacterium]
MFPVSPKICKWPPSEVLPERSNIIKKEGLKDASKFLPLLEQAEKLFVDFSAPTGLVGEISADQFERVFEGLGQNEPQAPLREIYPKAQALALFGITLGPTISSQIESLFESDDFVLGYLLDCMASLACERAVDHASHQFADAYEGLSTMAYSPGYCGWHISAQKTLFQMIEPQTIGISLNEDFLMSPLKSTTGVLVAGPREIHGVKPGYPFCRQCKCRTCLDRLTTVQ